MFRIFTQIILMILLNFSLNMWSTTFVDNEQDRALCVQHLNRFEELYDIPKNLLKSISTYETGIWPWSINVQGKPYYFANKSEAVKAVSYLASKGYESIDVGCMQINLRHHPNAFTTLEEAFDPEFNVAYAAKFLRNNFDEVKNWQVATAHYHSKTASYGNKYANGVMNIMKKKLYDKPVVEVQKVAINTVVQPISNFSPEFKRRIQSPMIIKQVHQDASRYLFNENLD